MVITFKKSRLIKYIIWIYMVIWDQEIKVIKECANIFKHVLPLKNTHPPLDFGVYYIESLGIWLDFAWKDFVKIPLVSTSRQPCCGKISHVC